MRRRLIRLTAVAGLLLLYWAALDLMIVIGGAENDQSAVGADVIILLGCKPYENGQLTACIRARSSHAASLYARGLAATIIASGGPSLHGPAEAGVMAGLLRGAGVPEKAIIQEDGSHNTIQNIANSRAIMQKYGWRTAIIVTEPYHITRAAIIARDAGMVVYPSPAVDSPDWEDAKSRAILLAGDSLKLMLYQVKSALGIMS